MMPVSTAISAPSAPRTVPRGVRRIRTDWKALAAPAENPAAFDPESLAALPEPARRWLSHAITPGMPLWRSVHLDMAGQIKLGAWRRFRARQVLAPPDGFVWAATASVFGLPVSGYDRYSSGVGEMRWRLLGMLPVNSATGADVTRSAAGRLAAECVLLPTCYPGAEWAAGSTKDSAVATWRLPGGAESAEVRVGPGGQVRDVRISRWGNPNGAPFGRYPFGVTVEREGTFAGITLPTVLRAGWWRGTDRQSDGEFFRATITAAAFR